MSDMIKRDGGDERLPIRRDLFEDLLNKNRSRFSGNTIRGYRADVRKFLSFCEREGAQHLPAHEATVAAFLSDLADKGQRFNTIQRARSAVAAYHRDNGKKSPCRGELVSETLKRIRIQSPKAEPVKAAVASLARSMVERARDTQEKLALIMAFRLAARRSEVCALDAEDLEFRDDRIVVHFRKHLVMGQLKPGTKSSRGEEEAVPLVDDGDGLMKAARDLVDSYGGTGPLFRKTTKRGDVVRRKDKWFVAVVKRSAKASGLDPDEFSGHSMRRGFVTSAIRQGKTIFEVMKQTRHRSIATLQRYYEDLDAELRDDPSKGMLSERSERQRPDGSFGA